LSISLDVRIYHLLKEKIVKHTFIANRAGNVYWCKAVITNHIEVHLDILWHSDFYSTVNLVLVLGYSTLAPLHVNDTSFLDLILVYKPNDFLLLTLKSNLVA